VRVSRLLLTLPVALFVLAQPAMAEEWIDTPTKQPVRKPVSPFDRATGLINEGQFESAIQEYMIAIQADPGNVEAHYRLGLLYQRLRRWDQAAQVAEKAYRLDNKNPDVMALWGHTLLRQGRNPESIWVLEGLIRLNAGRSMNGVYYDLAQACFGMKWYDRSVDYALRHLQSGETPQGHALLARTYLALGQKDRALGELQKAVQLYENVDDMLR
jgi:tetratricopeptide (TPR) repeat protein